MLFSCFFDNQDYFEIELKQIIRIAENILTFVQFLIMQGFKPTTLCFAVMATTFCVSVESVYA